MPIRNHNRHIPLNLFLQDHNIAKLTYHDIISSYIKINTESHSSNESLPVHVLYLRSSGRRVNKFSKSKDRRQEMEMWRRNQ